MKAGAKTPKVGFLYRFIRWVVTPFTRSVYARVDNRIELKFNARTHDIDRRTDQLVASDAEVRTLFSKEERRVAAIDERLQAIELHLPALLNTISSQFAAERLLRRELDTMTSRLEERLAERATVDQLKRRAHDIAEQLHARIGDVEQRLEFVRREMLYELRFGSGASMARREPAAGGDRPRLEARDGPLRLNIGAGHLPLPGWVNVDSRDLDGIDCIADARDLPCDPATVDAIRAAHLLEHFHEAELLRAVLPHWHDVLAPDGSLVVIVPDAEAMLAAHSSGEMDFDQLRVVTFGVQEYVGDDHHTMFSGASLCALLEKAGFEKVEVVESARPNGLCLEMEVHAKKPCSSPR